MIHLMYHKFNTSFPHTFWTYQKTWCYEYLPLDQELMQVQDWIRSPQRQMVASWLGNLKTLCWASKFSITGYKWIVWIIVKWFYEPSENSGGKLHEQYNMKCQVFIYEHSLQSNTCQHFRLKYIHKTCSCAVLVFGLWT